MTPITSARHLKALITAILTVFALVATTTTKTPQTPTPQADRTAPSIHLKLIQETATLSQKSI